MLKRVYSIIVAGLTNMNSYIITMPIYSSNRDDQVCFIVNTSDM